MGTADGRRQTTNNDRRGEEREHRREGAGEGEERKSHGDIETERERED